MTDRARPGARHRARRFGAITVVVALVAAGCSGGEERPEPSAPSGAAGTTPAPRADGGADGTTPARPPGPVGTVADALTTCAGDDDVEDPERRPGAGSAVGVDDPDVDGAGDPVVPDLGDPGIDVERYDLDLVVDGASIDARARLEVRLLDADGTIALDLLGLDVTSVTVDGDRVPARRDGAKLVIPVDGSDEGQVLDVAVCYEGEPEAVRSDAIEGAAIGWSGASDGSFVLSEPEGARTWFPANDVPTDKAAFAISVSVDDGLVAVANGALVAGPTACTGEVVVDGAAGAEVPTDGTDPCAGDVPAAAASVDGRAEFHWRMDAPMAPYLATVAVGDYERAAYPAVGDVPVEGWAPVGVARGLRDLAVQPEVLEVLVDLLGPYPFATYGGVVLPGTPDDVFLRGVALETQAMAIYAPGTTVESVIVHETAHQWFGDSVTVESWRDDLWWVEGFATYAEWVWLEAGEGVEAYDDAVRGAARLVERSEGRIGRAPDDGLFDPLRYQGGGLVFHALRREIGEEDFVAFLRTFVDRYRHANASTDDLIAVAEEVSGEDLEGFFTDWLDEPDPDRRPAVPR